MRSATLRHWTWEFFI